MRELRALPYPLEIICMDEAHRDKATGEASGKGFDAIEGALNAKLSQVEIARAMGASPGATSRTGPSGDVPYAYRSRRNAQLALSVILSFDSRSRASSLKRGSSKRSDVSAALGSPMKIVKKARQTRHICDGL